MNVDLLVIGDSFEDLIFFQLQRLPNLSEEVQAKSFLRTLGGGCVITAIAARRMGLNVAAVSHFNPQAEALLRQEGIEVINIRKDNEPWAITSAHSTGTDRAFVTYNPLLQVPDLEPRLIEQTRRAIRSMNPKWFHVAWGPCNLQMLFDALDGLPTETTASMDIGWQDHIDHIDAQFVNKLHYWMLNTHEAARYSPLTLMHDRLHVVIKHGEYGASLDSLQGNARSPAITIEAVDTTGAGDAFNGGFIGALLSGMSHENALSMGCRFGAAVTTQPGGILGLPSSHDAKKWLETP